MASLFAHLLRPIVQDHYDVRTDVPVGDMPRKADILLLRRRSKGPTPFRSIWSHLTDWNVLEFKGPTVDPRLHDPDLLIEVGLGVERRLNEEREKQSKSRQPRGAVSFWYLAGRLGRRFRTEIEALLRQPLEPLGDGLWRCPCLGRWLFLVSRDKLTVDWESVPLHLLGQEPPEEASELARTVLLQPGFWESYGSWLLYLHPELRGEVERMARAAKKWVKWKPDIRPLVEMMGMDEILRQLDLKKLDAANLERIVDAAGVERIVDVLPLTPEQLADLKRRRSAKGG